MRSRLTARSELTRTASRIYGSIVAQARQSTFYEPWGVPDSREGRFEMLALHMALVMLRLGRVGNAGQDLSRTLAETFIADMDDNMRELGIGDLAVPKKIKRAAAALYDRHRDYGAALTAGDETGLARSIAEAVTLAVLAADPDAGPTIKLDSAALAGYTGRFWGGLVVTSDPDCLAGVLPMPWPPR
jgi:cytochrome b pre-mRNA-processing protein 3